MIWINIGSWTTFGLTVIIDSASVPTLINGITTSTSIVIAVFFAVLGILHRSIMEKSDPNTKEFYLRAMIVLMVPLFWLWTTYVFLTIGLTDFAIRYALSGLLTALIICISITIVTAAKMATEIEKKPEEVEQSKKESEPSKATGQTVKKRKWLSLEALTLIALLVSTGFTAYFAWRSDNLQNNLSSLTYFQPFIFSINATSALNSAYCARNDTFAVLIGSVAVNLKVVTPYDGVLTIDIRTLNTTRIDELNSEPNMSLLTLNYSEHSPSFADAMIHQYFISRNVINSVEDNLVVRLAVILKSDWISPNSNGIGFDLGDLMFEASLFAIQKNETTKQAFFEDVYGIFTPT